MQIMVERKKTSFKVKEKKTEVYLNKTVREWNLKKHKNLVWKEMKTKNWKKINIKINKIITVIKKI